MALTLRERLAQLLGFAPEAKASKTAKFIAWTSAGQPVWTPRDFAALAREGFAKNAIVYRSVRMIAEAAASVKLFLFDGEREVDDHPRDGVRATTPLAVSLNPPAWSGAAQGTCDLPLPTGER